jgi:two-component system cell cycle sensor histidine kinase/response regulator CckA
MSSSRPPFSLFLDPLPTPVWICDEERIVYLNTACVELLGADNAERVLGRSPLSFLADGCHQSFRQQMQVVLRTGSRARSQLQLVIGDGRQVEIEIFLSAVPLADSVAVQASITERPDKRSEESERELLLREREALLEAVGDGIVGHDLDGRCTFVNRAAQQLFGFSAEDCIGVRTHELWHHHREDGTVYPVEQCPMYQAVRFGVSACAEELFWRKDGSCFHGEYSVEPITVQGSMVGAVFLIRDITRRKRTEEERERLLQTLEHERARLRAIVENVPVGILMAEAPSGRVIMGNRRLEEIFRHPLLHSTNISEHRDWVSYHPDGRRVEGHEYPLTRAVMKGEVTRGDEYLYSRGDGTLGWVRMSGAPIRDREGNIIAGVAAISDIDQEKRAEEALRKSEERFRFLANSIPHHLWEADATGAVDYHSAQAYAYVGFSPEQAVDGSAWVSFIHPEDVDRVLAAWEEALKLGQKYCIEYRLRGADGAYRWFQVHALPLRDEHGEVIRWYGSGSDIHERIVAEQALRESEMRYELAAKVTSDVVWDWNLLSTEVRRAKSLNTVFGYDAAQVPAAIDWWYERIHPEDRERVMSGMHAAIEGKSGTWRDEYRFVRADGSFAIVLDRGIIVRDAEGRATRMAGTMVDVTATRQSEQALWESEERFRRIFEDASMAMALVDPNDMHLLSVNPAFVRMFGYSGEEALGLTVEALTHPDDVPALQRDDRRGQLLRGEISGFTVEKRYLRRDGQVLWGRLTVSPIRSDRGTVQFFLSMIEDVTVQKQTEDALRRSEQLLQMANEAAGVGATVWDIEKDQVTLSSGYLQVAGLTGYGFEPSVERWLKTLHEEDRPGVAEIARKVKAGVLKAYQTEYRQYWPDGSLHWMLNKGKVVAERDGRSILLVGAAIDITERKELEEQLRQAQKMEAIGQLAGGIAHDFNNLLMIINGYAELLAGEYDAASTKGLMAQAILDAGNRAARLIDQLMTFSRRQILQPRVIDLDEHIRNAEPMLRSLVREEVAFKANLHSAAKIKVDPGQFDQVLMNLAVNARDAMPEGGTLAIASKKVELGAKSLGEVRFKVSPGTYVLLEISDTGVGMTDEVQHHIFEPFFTTKGVGKGTGLGLAIVFGIIRQSNGYILHDSAPGRGTTFRIYLPTISEEGNSKYPMGGLRIAQV